MIVAPAGGVALASAVLADNTGPPATAAEVQKIFDLVRAVFPNATRVFGSTWDKFVAEISPAEVASLINSTECINATSAGCLTGNCAPGYHTVK